MNEVLIGLSGVNVIMVDILVYGKTQEKHDRCLQEVLDRIEKSGLKLNKEKCFLNRKQVKCFGHLISKEGIKPSQEKVEAIKDMPPPENVSQLRTVMGMLNYHAKFINHLATMIKPMSDLLKDDVAWYWSKPQDEAFQKAKEALSDMPMLCFIVQLAVQLSVLMLAVMD